MNSKYKSYPKYKESENEWLGKIPEKWNRASLRWLSRIYAGGTPSKDKIEYWTDGTIPWINSGAVNQRIIEEPSTYITEEALKNSSAKWIPANSLVMALAGQGKTKGSVARTAIETTCNQSMAAICPSDVIDSAYLYWWLTSQYSKIRGLAGDDLRDGLNLVMVGSIPCPIPLREEQRNISSFLDRETRRIDKLITKKERQIELLKEKRQALISHAVTKGLYPNTKMKDSGIEWLGKVPEMWEVMRLKRLVSKIGSGITPRGGSQVYQDKGVMLLRSQNIHFDGLRLEDVAYIDDETDQSMADTRVKANDVLLNITGASIGRCTHYPSDYPAANVNQHVCIIRPQEGVVSKFIASSISSHIVQYQIDAQQTGSSREGLNFQQVGNLIICVPQRELQESIVVYLDCETERIDILSTKIHQSIDKLREYRTALISAAVTGKIDVREEM